MIGEFAAKNSLKNITIQTSEPLVVKIIEILVELLLMAGNPLDKPNKLLKSLIKKLKVIYENA